MNTAFNIFLSILLCGTVLSGSAQNSATADVNKKIEVRRPNIVKINTMALLFKNASIVYERALAPRLSVGMGFGYKYSGKEPRLFSTDDDVIDVSLTKITGFTVSPEARYYLRSCDPGKLEGFYGGVYSRFTDYKSGASFVYTPDDNPAEQYSADIKLREFGFGIQLGYQLLLGDKFSVDFLFFGPRFSRYKMNYEFNQPSSDAFLTDLSDYVNDIIDRLGFDYEVDIENEGDAMATSSFSFANMRFGISVGYAF